MESNYLKSVLRQFQYYKNIGNQTFDQLDDENIHWQYNATSNSISIIVKHIVGNQLSRWTNFLTEDGEKKWRKRDAEFEDSYNSKEEMVVDWENGWKCLFTAIESLKEDDLNRIIYIRNEGQTALDAINRQLCHYSYHVGQIVSLAKMIRNEQWVSLSIPKNKSKEYNANKFTQEKSNKHFTDNI